MEKAALLTGDYPTRPSGCQSDSFPSLDAFRGYMETLVRTMANDSATVIMATEPFLYSTHLTEEEEKSLWMNKRFCRDGIHYVAIPSMISGMNAFNDATRDIARNLNMDCVDLERAIPKTRQYFLDDCHYTPSGSARVASALFDYLVAHGTIEKRLATRSARTNTPPRIIRP